MQPELPMKTLSLFLSENVFLEGFLGLMSKNIKVPRHNKFMFPTINLCLGCESSTKGKSSYLTHIQILKPSTKFVFLLLN